jgi:hypothetical protein
VLRNHTRAGDVGFSNLPLCGVDGLCFVREGELVTRLTLALGPLLCVRESETSVHEATQLSFQLALTPRLYADTTAHAIITAETSQQML